MERARAATEASTSRAQGIANRTPGPGRRRATYRDHRGGGGRDVAGRASGRAAGRRHGAGVAAADGGRHRAQCIGPHVRRAPGSVRPGAPGGAPAHRQRRQRRQRAPLASGPRGVGVGPQGALLAAVEPLADGATRLRRQASDALGCIDVRRVSLLLLLFFSLAFNNAIVDSMKDTLIVTSGGAEQLPFLTVYAVLPSSAVFLYVYNKISGVLGRASMFYLTIGSFMAFFGAFGFLLFPNVDALHAAPAPLVDGMLSLLPGGLSAAAGIVSHWTYTLFYTFAELWGDVVLGFLFWGLANECTKVHEAGLVYPIICCGANLAYACAGAFMRALGTAGMLWDQQLRCLMAIFLLVASGSCAVYSRVQRTYARGAPGAQGRGGGVRGGAPGAQGGAPGAQGGAAAAPSLASIFERREIALLAVMSVAQGIAFSIFQVSWKSQIFTLCPTPAAYQAMMASVQLYSGLTTLAFIAVAPLIFRFLGWTGAAVSTPIVMATGGTAFLLASPLCVRHPSLSLPVALLGSSVYVFMKAAKYSLFKPSEEMVYIDLDERSRTTGKAAVDVLGAQAGKAGGSCVQQLLLLCFQTLSAATAPLVALHCGVIGLWVVAVRRLSPSMKFRTRARARARNAGATAAAAAAGEGPAAEATLSSVDATVLS